ncbi:MAG: DUF2894 domain-containing protein [Rubrivivax sp.]|nr:MAG: DUF2894 domain-containing protein [Rubrivivax sp.]
MTALDDPVAWALAQDVDPVRGRVLEGLARRAAAQPPGALRQRLVARLVQRAEAHFAAAPARVTANVPSALTALVAELQATPELRTLRVHDRTWSALRLQRRMVEVSAPVPEHLGPLNSQVLVTRALQKLQTLSPNYLQRLLTQLDCLAALAPLQLAAEAERPARSSAKKPVTRKRQQTERPG